MIVVNKQVNGISFKTPSGLIDLKGNGVLNNVKDEDWEYILKNWKKFIQKITFSDKNPQGFLVYNMKEKEVKAEQKELEHSEGVEGGKRLTKEEADEICLADMSFKELKGLAMEMNIAFSSSVKKKDLIKLINEKG